MDGADSSPHLDIMGKVLTQLPSEVTPEIQRACVRIGLADHPRFIDISPDPSAKVNKCIFNVLTAASAGRGTAVVGWKIHAWPQVLVEFVGHAVLRTDVGLVCITPDGYGEAKVLFVPDARIEFNPSDPMARMPARRVACTDHEDVAAFIRTQEQMDAIRMAYPPQSGYFLVTGPAAARLQGLERAQRRAFRDIALRTVGHNAPCICDSGRPFKKCCRRGMLFERNAE